MVKRAAKKKTARKKSAKKSSKKGPVNVPEIREQVRHLIAEQIEPMVTANTEEATKGHLSQLKYLFEVGSIRNRRLRRRRNPRIATIWRRCF